MNQGFRTLRLAGIILLWLLLSTCSEIDDKQQILALLADMEKSLEERDLDGFMEPLDPQLQVQGIGGPRELRARIAFYLMRHRQIGIHVISKTVTLEKDLQRGNLHFGAVVAGADGNIPERADMLDIDADLHKQDGDWRVISVRWERGVYIGE